MAYPSAVASGEGFIARQAKKVKNSTRCELIPPRWLRNKIVRVDREAEPGIKAVQMLALNHHKSRATSLSAMQARDSPFLTWQNCPLITHASGIFLSPALRPCNLCRQIFVLPGDCSRRLYLFAAHLLHIAAVHFPFDCCH